MGEEQTKSTRDPATEEISPSRKPIKGYQPQVTLHEGYQPVSMEEPVDVDNPPTDMTGILPPPAPAAPSAEVPSKPQASGDKPSKD